MLFHQLICTTAACLFVTSCATTNNEPIHIWKNQKGQDALAFYVRSTSGSQFKVQSVGEPNITKDNQGFVSIQVPLTNNLPFRKSANIGWEWQKSDGMVTRSPLGNSLRAVNVAGRDTQILHAVSSVPEPRVVTLIIHPPN